MQNCLTQGIMEGWVLEMVIRVDRWDAMGKAVLAETEPRSQIFSE